MKVNPRPRVILRRRQVEARTGLSRSTIYASIKKNTFPAPILIGASAVGWLEEDVDQWIDARVKESRCPVKPVVKQQASRAQQTLPLFDLLDPSAEDLLDECVGACTELLAPTEN